MSASPLAPPARSHRPLRPRPSGVLRHARPRVELRPKEEHPASGRLGGFYASVELAVGAAELLDVEAVAVAGPGRNGYWLSALRR